MSKGGQSYWRKESTGKSSLDRNQFAAWAKDIQECEQNYQVDSKYGLFDGEVELRLQKFGRNELERHEGQSVFRLILDQFDDALVRNLLSVAVISFVLAWYDCKKGGEMDITAFVESLVIFLIVIVDVIVGVWQESNAVRAVEVLKEILSVQATVIRNGRQVLSVPAKELVPGDIVELRCGDKIPADMRVINLISSTLWVKQRSLTGESEAVSKTTKPVPEESDIQGKKSMVFAGTTVVDGNCICMVTDTGMNTEIGKVHSQIQDALQNEEDTLLKKQLNEFGEVLTKIIRLACALVWFNLHYFLTREIFDSSPMSFNLSSNKCTYYCEIAIAFTVAAIPEGLPAVFTTCLALGTRKMAQKNVIVRKLSSIETLGCTTVICSNKTGILTTNQIAVAKLVAMGHGTNDVRSFSIEGTTYNPLDGKIQDWPAGRMDANLQTIAKISALANDARIERSETGYVITGMPTEAALKVLVEKMGLPAGLGSGSSPEHIDLMVCSQAWCKIEHRIATLEFDSDRKSMGVIVSSKSGRNTLLVKGAVENLLERSSYIQLLDGSVVELDKRAKTVILDSLNKLSSAALRVLGFAYKEDPPEFATYNGNKDHPAHNILLDPANYSTIESNLIFVGLAGLRDPPRKEVRQAIEDCRAAGIQVIVITEDKKNTSEAICREIGIFGQHEDISSRSLTGKEFMDHRDQKGHLAYKGGLLFSRAEPRHKKEIVRLLKDAGEVVAMVGDGVVDAPALRLANIGIAMGIAGNEVAMEVSDIVLTESDFSIVVAAVGEGRSVYNNMKTFILYMISSNIGKVASIFFTSAIGVPGLIPVQLIWVNLMTNGPPATALAFNLPGKYIMKKARHKRENSLINGWIIFRYLVIGLYVGVATVGVFVIWFTSDSFLGIDLSQDGHSLVTYSRLAKWGRCKTWDNFTVSPFKAGDRIFNFDSNPCDYFQYGRIKAVSLSLSVLVAIETFTAVSALSEYESLLTMPPWVNPWLLIAMSVSFGLHFLLLYIPFLAQVFWIVPLSLNEWLLVLSVALPAIFIDEFLKFVGRLSHGTDTSPKR